MAETLEQLVEQVTDRERRLQSGMPYSGIEGLVLQMHTDLAEFMEGVLTWMRVREDLERRGGKLSYGG